MIHANVRISGRTFELRCNIPSEFRSCAIQMIPHVCSPPPLPLLQVISTTAVTRPEFRCLVSQRALRRLFYVTNILKRLCEIISSCLSSLALTESSDSKDRTRISFPRVATPLRDATNSDLKFQGRRSSREFLAT